MMRLRPYVGMPPFRPAPRMRQERTSQHAFTKDSFLVDHTSSEARRTESNCRPSRWPVRHEDLNGMPHCGAPLLRESRRHIREKRAESFRHGRMCENGITQVRVWQARQNSHLYHGHGFAGFGAYHREAKNAVV